MLFGNFYLNHSFKVLDKAKSWLRKISETGVYVATITC